ncbi:24792_t:CDS:2, partial [Gigaspora margarita]
MCTRSARLLILEQTLKSILEVLKYIITKNEEYLILEEGYYLDNEKYNKWSDSRYFYGTEIKKVEHMACKQSQKPVELGYLNEMDNEYNTSWCCRNGTNLEIELLNICNGLFQKVNQEKEETAKGKGELNGLDNLVKTNDTSWLEGFEYDNKERGIKKDEYETDCDSSKNSEYYNGQTWASRLKKTEKDRQKEVSTDYQRLDKTIFISEMELVGYEVKKDKDKGVKVGMEFLLTYLRLTIVDRTENVEDQKEEMDNKTTIKANENCIRKTNMKDVLVNFEEFKVETLVDKNDKNPYDESSDAADMNNKIVNHLFDPEEKCLPEHPIVSPADLAL